MCINHLLSLHVTFEASGQQIYQSEQADRRFIPYLGKRKMFNGLDQKHDQGRNSVFYFLIETYFVGICLNFQDSNEYLQCSLLWRQVENYPRIILFTLADCKPV